MPDEVLTDGMAAYPRAVGKEFGRFTHRRVPSTRAKESNNRVERLHGTEKERTKVMRAFDNDAGAASTAEGFRVHYNLVREHEALGKTPGEAAGLPPLEGLKWKKVLEAAVKSNGKKTAVQRP